MSKRILITARDFPKQGEPFELLANAGYELFFKAPPDPMKSQDLGKFFPGMDGVILGVDECDSKALAKADKLQVISRFGVGYDAVDVQAASLKGIVITRAVGANASAVAELSFAYLFALARNLVQIASAAKANHFIRPRGWELSGKTMGIVGLGEIGQRVAHKALALGMQVMAYHPYYKPLANVQLVPLDELFQSSDVVSLHCALTPETKGLVNQERIKKMKPGSYLLNTARGALVDDKALYEALSTGHLAGAAMDAFIKEPPLNNPLLQLDTFIATDHIGANTHEAVANVALLAAQNIVAILEGKPCSNCVNPEVYKTKTR